MSVPVSGSGRHVDGASEQTHANSPVAGSKRARREEREQRGVSVPVSGSERHVDGASKQTHANSPVAGSKRARREEREQRGVSVPVSERERPDLSVPGIGSGCHREGASEQTHANLGAIDDQCPVEVVIVDGPDDSSVTKSAANGRRSRSTCSEIVDIDEGQDTPSSSLQKSKDNSCPEADPVSCLSMCEVC